MRSLRQIISGLRNKPPAQQAIPEITAPAGEIALTFSGENTLKDNFGRTAVEITTSSGSTYLLKPAADASIKAPYIVPYSLVGMDEIGSVKGYGYNSKRAKAVDGEITTTSPVQTILMDDGSKIRVTGIDHPRGTMGRFKAVTLG